MDFLQRSLALADEILNEKSAQEFEQEYLSLKCGIGPTVSSLLVENCEHSVSSSFDISTLAFVSEQFKVAGNSNPKTVKSFRVVGKHRQFTVDLNDGTNLPEAA
ncbi:hypothetical protein U0358_03720 [Idiomarina sp. PL1-037]|uniref:hypothetical protein n=1 Tax=unclassified Idiomarina TaxID=2614829 RepID=UPI002ACC2541|nr:hypothetical protein [Idiomarina sp. PL1-037]WQC53676.1 hypothetical protein U0358_03720 [Idiomarina sp. PL1-037]